MMKLQKMSALKLERGHARRAGLVEEVMLIQYRQKVYANFAMYGELRQGFTKVQISHALRNMFLKYPILATTVIPDRLKVPDDAYYRTDEYYNKPGVAEDYISVLDKIKYEDVIMNLQSEHSSYVNKILSQWALDGCRFSGKLCTLIDRYRFPYWDPTKPQFRLILLPTSETNHEKKHVLFVSNHVVSDGTSGANFLQDLSTELGQLKDPLESIDTLFNYEDDYESLPKLPDPIEKRVSYAVTMKFIPPTVLRQLAKRFLAKKWDEPITVPIDESPSAHLAHVIRLDAATMQKLRMRVKEKLHGKATLTPFLQTCWFVSCYQAGLFENLKWNEYFTNIVLPLNSRQFLPDDPEVRNQFKYGTNVGGSDYYHLISSFNVKDSKQFWDLTNYYQECYAYDRKEKAGLQSFGLLISDFVTKSKNIEKLYVDDMQGQKRGFTLFSNIGYFPQKSQETNPYQLQDIGFTQTGTEMPYVFCLNCVSTDINGMSFTVTCAEKAIPETQWHKLLEIFENNLTTL
ncbi:alcohol O-acetyltransferase 1 [Kluyveromyces marxianus]|uniref:Alcohol O-acetyltransferase 1 n=2 Tax=Kluyveromyces marxianus TaxID=4911 RepID=W0T8X1_KLUMD|nr:alcohol O-acetyltransferase 1 [Kluyveromyces marxianus DMKU3-1042]QGN15215.1 alcohol O-acetyltransferase 1 [Kluyveromyces marxianus]BAO39498.1 alcohol O-acetyltransferase 1 [Kluyveromyces marxianus DMKU3-1042]